MKKRIYSLLLAVSTVFSVTTFANNPFGALTRSIEESADKWIEEFVSKLNITQQAMYLNLFIQPSSSSVEASIKCVQEIQSNESLKEVSEQLEHIMQQLIGRYISHMQKKFESLKKTGSKDMQSFMQKLEKKIYELVGHFYGIYYTKLYRHIEKQDPTALYYMFDEHGMIAVSKRSKPLPKPTA